MSGAGGITEALDSLLASAGLTLPPWLIPAIFMVGFLFLLPHIRQNQRTHKARKMIQERTALGGARSETVHQEILALANGNPITFVVIADEAHRRGLTELARKALRALEQTGKRHADIRRLRTAIDGPMPIFPEAEREAIINLMSKGLFGLAEKRLERAKRHWPNQKMWVELEQKVAQEE